MPGSLDLCDNADVYTCSKHTSPHLLKNYMTLIVISHIYALLPTGVVRFVVVVKQLNICSCVWALFLTTFIMV